jgi:hypothetical protein
MASSGNLSETAEMTEIRSAKGISCSDASPTRTSRKYSRIWCSDTGIPDFGVIDPENARGAKNIRKDWRLLRIRSVLLALTGFRGAFGTRESIVDQNPEKISVHFMKDDKYSPTRY